MTCRDCFHCGVCDIADDVEYTTEEQLKEDCVYFTNKADFVEVKHGYWKEETKFLITDNPDDDGYWASVYICSNCGREESRKEPYCHCGAKMDKE